MSTNCVSCGVQKKSGVSSKTFTVGFPDLFQRIEDTGLAREDVLGGFAPDEGLRLYVVLYRADVDRVLEIVAAGETAPTDVP